MFHPPSIALLLAVLLLLNPARTTATEFERVEQNDGRFLVEHIAGDFGVPWGLAFIDDDRLLVSVRGRSYARLLNVIRTARRKGGYRGQSDRWDMPRTAP